MSAVQLMICNTNIINLKNMQRNDKEINPFLFELSYTQIRNSTHYFYINAIFISLQFLLLLCKLYFLIDSSILESLSVPFLTIFICLTVLLSLFAGLTLFSYHFQLLNSIWVYFLIFLQAIEVVFVQISISCFRSNGWCGGDSKFQLSALILLIGFILIIYLRSHCYCPFNDCSNPLSMNGGRSVVYMFIYCLIMAIITNDLIISNVNAAKQIAFLLTCALYAVIATPPYANPSLARLFSVCSVGLIWTSGLIWLTPIFQSLLSITTDSLSTFWYCWGYSFPIVLGLGFVQTSYLSKGYDWKELFHNVKNDDLRCLYLQTTQLVKVMEIIRRSELRSNSAEFKSLWELIKLHNDKCDYAECSLRTLKGLPVERGDEMMQQKRFTKTVEKTLQFGLMKLVKQKDIFPNMIELNLQIANYELQVFHQRTKGLQLYNREYNKPTLEKEQKWGIFFLKRKIEGFDTTGEIRVKGESEEDISSFKHDIQVSVSMLAEFWYFLSDPKCNLKKLYDLANVLFPMKIKVDQTWKMIRQFKSIECYNLYAKYLIKMFNDKEKGLKILEEARKLQIQNNQKEQITAGTQGNLNEQHGVIFLEFDGKNSGIMYQVNSSCQLIFGYNKGEMQGRKVNDIMPKVYSIHHDKILQNYQQTNRPKMMNKERVVWGKSKDGYLFPFTICIKPVRNYYSQTSEVYASVKRDLWVRQSAFFFTDSDLQLSDVSASMLGMFPNLHGRIHLKKKVHIDEIVPGFQKFMDRIILQRESYDFTIDRVFSIGDGQEYTEKVQLSLLGEEVAVNAIGAIGYYFKVLKNSGLSSNFQPNSYSSNYKEANADASNSYWMKRENDFKFIASVEDSGSNSTKQKAMIYHGGLVKQDNQTRTLIHSRIQSSFERTKQQANQEHDAFEKIDYGKDIKIKRLIGSTIREIHDLSEQSEQNNLVGNNENEEQENLEMVKPSQLNSILSRQNGNNHINLLKLLTIVILMLSTLLSIFEYILTFTNNNTLVSTLSTISSQNSLEAQIMYINLYANLYSFGLISDTDVTNLKSEINELDSMASSIPFTIKTQITYSDGSNQSMILSFAIDKMISQAQLLASASNVLANDSSLFFVQYNSVNGLEYGCELALSTSQSQLLSSNDAVINTYAIYLAISASVFFLILVLKNIILRAVLKKKAEILNVFFQIPRYACSSIQKECERFIQRLTMDEDEQEFEFEIQGEDEESASKRYGRQKKRTIMGEEKTASTFIIVSLLLLVFLLIYPILVIISAKSIYANQQYSFTAASQIMSFQKETAKMMSFIGTHYSRANLPLAMTANSTQIIANEYLKLNNLIINFQQYLYYLGGILSSSYVSQYNQLFFNSLCDNTSCSSSFSYGESQGLNSILYYYFDYLVGKYELFSNSTPNISVALNATTIEKQRSLRFLLKKFWRTFSGILLSGISEFIKINDSALFAFMIAACIINMTVLMWAWIRFYNSLGQKIIATEYILTFIPIDEINKNPKIAKYIKEQVLRAQ